VQQNSIVQNFDMQMSFSSFHVSHFSACDDFITFFVSLGVSAGCSFFSDERSILCKPRARLSTHSHFHAHSLLKLRIFALLVASSRTD
jgi:hypothetical protein